MPPAAAIAPPPRPRPGGRSARVVHAVLEAALEELAVRGYAGLSIEEVAVRAGVNKTTVYRRWPTKSELVQSALSQMVQSDPSPDTGSVREDLFVLLHHRLARMSTPRGRSLARVFLLEGNSAELAQIMAALKHRRPSIPAAVIDRAIARGELPASVDRALITEALLSFYSRAIWHGRSLGDDLLRRLIDLVLTGAQHDGGRLPDGEAPAVRPARRSRG